MGICKPSYNTKSQRDMRTINIFIAGAKDLKPYRDAIKTLATDLNNRLKSRGFNYHIDTLSYENFGNIQDEYDDYICNTADLVLFILDGKIGSYTKDEYLLAKEQRDKSGRPKSAVFLKSYDTITPDIAYINGLLTKDDYYIEYSDIDDLKRKVESYIEDRFIYTNNQAKVDGSRLKRSIKWTIALLIAALIVASTTMAMLLHARAQEPVLLIAGGGSARNYIARYNNIELESYPMSYYVHMPSSNAWLLLTEEVISPQQSPKYVPICVSASSATDDDFLKITTKEHFLKSGSVIEFRLGYDTLAICTKRDPMVDKIITHESILDGEISSKELGRLIANDKEINTYATSPGSGTRAAYEKMLAANGIDINKHNVNQFSEYSDLPSINKNNKPYLLLGSKCYTMSDLRSIVAANNAYELKVYTASSGGKEYVCKPINLYFMAYKRTNTSDLEIPQQTIDFLNNLGYDLSDKVSSDNIIKPHTHNSVILKYAELPNQ